MWWLFLMAGVLIGVAAASLCLRRRQRSSDAENAGRLLIQEAETQLDRDRVASAERQRIYRDLHDDRFGVDPDGCLEQW